MRAKLIVLWLLLSCHLLSVGANPKQPDWSGIIIRAQYGFEYPSSYFNPPANTQIANSYEGILFVSLPPVPPLLGHFDETGKVIGGDYVLIYCVDLGTAPITTV